METLGILLKGKNTGIFKNTNDEYCQISRYYIGNNQKFRVIFSKAMDDIATRNAINTTSEKKVLKLIKEEGFVLDPLCSIVYNVSQIGEA